MTLANPVEANLADVTEDHLFDGRVSLLQHRKGYRVAIDPVFLAAIVPAQAGQQVLDMGCGSGAATLCLATRVPGVRITGLELQGEMVALMRHNVSANGLGEVIRIMTGDVISPPPELVPGSFDHVMANPPFMEPNQGNPPPDAVKAIAMVEGKAQLADWIHRAGTMLRSGGTFSLVHRADRLDSITRLMAQQFGDVVICPLWPGPGRDKPAKRILVQGTKDGNSKTRTTPGIILHGESGTYTEEAKQVLRSGLAYIL